MSSSQPRHSAQEVLAVTFLPQHSHRFPSDHDKEIERDCSRPATYRPCVSGCPGIPDVEARGRYLVVKKPSISHGPTSLFSQIMRHIDTFCSYQARREPCRYTTAPTWFWTIPSRTWQTCRACGAECLVLHNSFHNLYSCATKLNAFD